MMPKVHQSLSCNAVLAALQGYAGHSLSADHRVAVRAHLSGCERCASAYANAAELDAHLTEQLRAVAATQRPPERAWRELQSKLGRAPTRARRLPWVLSASLASLLLMASSLFNVMRLNLGASTPPTVVITSIQRVYLAMPVPYVPADAQMQQDPAQAEPLGTSGPRIRIVKERVVATRFGGWVDLVSDAITREMPHRPVPVVAVRQPVVNGWWYTFDDIVPDFFCTTCGRWM